ncbi:unnamed protein product [Ectocarpus sp. 12 AP-2014]
MDYVPITRHISSCTVPQTDRDALVALYDAAGGSNWKSSGNWNTNADLSKWHGINVNGQGRVVGVDLAANNLQGSIPAALGALSKLERLWLCRNQLTGTIPETLGELSASVVLHLERNQLTAGNIPEELGALGKLRVLALYNNQLIGEIPARLGQLCNLQDLSLAHNKLRGSIPGVLGTLSNLREVRLSDNQLTGCIPKELGALTKLELLTLYVNALTGIIPPELGNLGVLRELRLFRNMLTGSIPASLGQLRNLEKLDLSDNRLDGGIPMSLGQLDKLQRLYLNQNMLSGPILKELGDLRALTHLGLYENGLIDTPKKLLAGGSLTQWQEKLRGAGQGEPWVISLTDFLIAVWHFLLPIFDDVTDLMMLLATFEGRGWLWWACCGVFVLADAERVLLLLVAFSLILCWVPFALLGTDETRGQRFEAVFRFLNGGHDLTLEPVVVRSYPVRGVVWGIRPSALRWPILDGIMWATVGSRSKSSALMRLCGMAGNTPVEQLEQTGFGLSLIDRIVFHHPYSALGRILFSCPHGHHLPGSYTSTRRSGVMLRAVGETLVVDSLFLALSLATETWEDGVSIGIVSLIFSVLELLTELQHYLAEARAGMVADREETTESVNVPSRSVCEGVGVQTRR